MGPIACGGRFINVVTVMTLMYRLSHRLFALGASSAVAFFLNVNVLMLPVILPIAYMIGSFPDIDIKLNIRHRGVTHHVGFFILMTLACTFAMFYLFYFLQLFITIPIFGIEVVMYDWFPLPMFFYYIGTFQYSKIIGEAFFNLNAFFFVSFMTHFSLDMITPAGLDVGDRHVFGGAKSNSTFYNLFFGASGLVTFMVSFSLSFIRYFHLMEIPWTTWFFIIDGSIMTFIFIIAMITKAKEDKTELKCFDVDNKITICIPRGKCFKIGNEKDDKICNIPEGDI